MNMNMQATRFWTFDTLVGAFLDLFIAYFLLCASTIALFAVNFLGFFGLSLPIPYNGFMGIHSSDYRSLLVEYPIDKISTVQFSATGKFPFDSIFFGVHNPNLKQDLNPIRGDDGFMELNDEASCSSKSDARKHVGNEIDDSGVMIDKEKGLNYRSVSSSSNWVTCVDQQSNDDEEHSCRRPEGTSFLSDVNCEYSVNKRIPVNEADKDKMIDLLTRELEVSQAARAAVYVELEKERNAAASAADEAMSMIFRLQEEKASTKMELSQYKRMIEEKSAFDAEEMNILKEIVLRREREKHFLEKEVEAYRQLTRFENDQDFGLNEDFEFSKQEEVEKTISVVGEEKEKELEIKSDDESRAYDVHVVGNEPKSSEKTNENKIQIDQKHIGSPERFKSSLRRNSTSALDNERTRLDTEVEWLRERLTAVQEGRGKLKFSVENREKESLQLELLEDIARQLQEIRMLTEPQTTRQTALLLPSSKVGVGKRRRCTSVSSGLAKSS